MASRSESSGPTFNVEFDALALADDIARIGEAGVKVLVEFRVLVESQGGVSRDRLMSCQAEGRDGTRLGGCVKTYIPWPDGRYGAVMIGVSTAKRSVALRVIAFGIRHQPRGSRALTVYEVADRRLND